MRLRAETAELRTDGVSSRCALVYKNNCVGCPHRILVGVPNLATIAHEIERKSKPKSRGANARSGARKTSARRDTGRVSGA